MERTREKGSVAIESAIVMALLALAFMAIFDLMRIFMAYDELKSVAFNGFRESIAQASAVSDDAIKDSISESLLGQGKDINKYAVQVSSTGSSREITIDSLDAPKVSVVVAGELLFNVQTATAK